MPAPIFYVSIILGIIGMSKHQAYCQHIKHVLSIMLDRQMFSSYVATIKLVDTSEVSEVFKMLCCLGFQYARLSNFAKVYQKII